MPKTLSRKLFKRLSSTCKGSKAIWERLHYDWSDPNHVVLTTTDSNVWGGASGHTYTFTRQPNGTTDIDLTVVREGKNLKGWLLGFVLRTIGKHVLENAFENSIKAIEARNGAASEQALASMLTFRSVPCGETTDQDSGSNALAHVQK